MRVEEGARHTHTGMPKVSASANAKRSAWNSPFKNDLTGGYVCIQCGELFKGSLWMVALSPISLRHHDLLGQGSSRFDSLRQETRAHHCRLVQLISSSRCLSSVARASVLSLLEARAAVTLLTCSGVAASITVNTPSPYRTQAIVAG